MKKLFITIRIWEETKDKLEAIRVTLMAKNKRLVSLAETLEILVENYNNANKE